MGFDTIIRAFYTSTVIALVGAVVWGFSAAFGVIPHGGEATMSARYALVSFWGFAFVASCTWYAVDGRRTEQPK